MRQIRFLCAVLAVSVLSLTGCADIKNLSEEQENEIAEYAAGVLLQNSDKYPYRLITKEEKEVTETPTPIRRHRHQHRQLHRRQTHHRNRSRNRQQLHRKIPKRKYR